jgi:hypothetical protein
LKFEQFFVSPVHSQGSEVLEIVDWIAFVVEGIVVTDVLMVVMVGRGVICDVADFGGPTGVMIVVVGTGVVIVEVGLTAEIAVVGTGVIWAFFEEVHPDTKSKRIREITKIVRYDILDNRIEI